MSLWNGTRVGMRSVRMRLKLRGGCLPASEQGRQVMSNATGIELDEGGSKGRYVFRAEGAEAEMTFSKAGEHLIIIDHTEVPDAFRGQGVGLKLVTRAV